MIPQQCKKLIVVIVAPFVALTKSMGDPEVYELTDYIVTGSHFSTEVLDIDLPLTQIGEDDLRLWGNLSTREALLQQPASFGYANSDTQSNGITGSAGANLRGLGNLDTLTLINGRRAGGNSAVGFEHGGFADLNLIPIASISEVQVAADGTSVTYGSDAVAGTVNFLLHQNYLGSRLEATYSNTTENDASAKRLSFVFGEKLGDKAHLVLTGSWYQRNAIFARDRDISADADFSAQGGTNQRSGSFPGRIQVDGVAYALGTNVTTPATLGDFTTWPFELFNYNDFAPAIPELKQNSVMGHFTYDLTEQVEFWSELLYAETDFENALASAPWTLEPPSPFSQGSHPIAFAALAGSPHLPNLGGGTLESLSYRSLELGNLNNPSEKEAHRIVLGLKGQVDRWNWEAALMQIESKLDRVWSGILDESALATSITNGSFNPFAAAFSSGTNNGFTFDNANALQNASTTAAESFDEVYRSVDFRVGGPLAELPAGDLLTLVGAEYRRERIEVGVDPGIIFPTSSPGLTSSYSPYEAQRSAFSLFGESIVPILGQEQSETLRLDLQLAARYDEYSDESGAFKNRYDQTVYKVGFNMEFAEQLKAHGSFSTAFRAPTLNESFNTNFATLVYNIGTPENPNLQRYLTQLGANPDLDTEKSDVLNLGITYEPKYLEGFSATISYYRIKTDDAINHRGQSLLDAESENPSAIIRDLDNSPDIDLIIASRFNVAEVLNDGLEYELSYRKDLGDHTFHATAGVNQILGYEVTPEAGAQTIDFLGRLSHPLVPGESLQGPGSLPEYKGYAQLLWSHNHFTVGCTVNYIHSLDDNPQTTIDGLPREIDSWSSLDLTAQYIWEQGRGDWLAGATLTLGIDNVTDEEPPFASGAFADGYDSSLYSLEGRRIHIGLSKEF